jgi:hypothetical protein
MMLGGLNIDGQLELGRLLDGRSAGFSLRILSAGFGAWK